MPTYLQADRPLILTTPLGKDALLVTSMRGRESISRLFKFRLKLLAERDTKIPFDSILGQTVTLEMRLRNGDKRYFNALIRRFSQGGRDEHFIGYRAELVPKLWLLTKKIRSRIFQHLTVPDILHQVLGALDVSYELSGTYYPRDYCVQYRESDFDFVSRLMEEEGIYYYFKHSDGSHQMIVSDLPSKHPAIPGQANVIYEEAAGEVRQDMRVTAWQKTQEIRAGEYTVWDHCFELPGKHLEATEKTIDAVNVGEVAHKLNVGNDQLEIYDYPGGYAQRFDGIDRAGAPQPAELNRIFEDRTRTVRIRMEQEEIESLAIQGVSDCGHFTAGHEFTLERHFDADGEYLLTEIEHDAKQGDFRTDQTLAFSYENRFACVPDGLRYRPQRVTPKPVIAGTQTAVVVGPPGEEIFVDKYGRVKVQFHWDREGKKNADSSCWLRVAQVWAGNGWGAFFWPRIGHEVVVVFEEGDPDQPMIIGSVYNQENMPWFNLPINKKLAGFKSFSERGKAHKNFNGIVFNDEKGQEHLSIHSERNLSLNSETDKMIHAGRHKGERVALANVLTVGKLIPSTGGSGGGFDEGNPLPQPPPTGIVGLNSVVTYGDNFQVACPLNHQLAWGNNLQVCINPFGLAAGVPGIPAPGFLSALLGGGMGGNMQFTLGTSAQFTLGQSFEISVGPPKIEIHTGYNGHVPVILLCGLLGVASTVLVLAYDLLPVAPKPYSQATDSGTAAAQSAESVGDKDRAILVLVYQLLSDAILATIMGLESLLDKDDWFMDDATKELFSTTNDILQAFQATKIMSVPEGSTEFWVEWGALSLGCLGVVAGIAAEIAAVGAEA